LNAVITGLDFIFQLLNRFGYHIVQAFQAVIGYINFGCQLNMSLVLLLNFSLEVIFESFQDLKAVGSLVLEISVTLFS